MSDFRIRIAYYYVLIVRFKRSYAQNKIKEDIYTRDVFYSEDTEIYAICQQD